MMSALFDIGVHESGTLELEVAREQEQSVPLLGGTGSSMESMQSGSAEDAGTIDVAYDSCRDETRKHIFRVVGRRRPRPRRAYAAATRVVHINNPGANAEFPRGNRVSNTKYTPLNFVPKNLMEQFSRFMNKYYLMIALLQLWSLVTPVNPWTLFAPLIFIFSLSAAKEAYDDYNRYRADKRFNRASYTLVRPNGDCVPTASEEICCGDVVVVPADTEVPCDMVLLQTSEADGACYLQTANLDGETDYKTRQALVQTCALAPEQLAGLRGMIECEVPNGDLLHYDARMHIENIPRHINGGSRRHSAVQSREGRAPHARVDSTPDHSPGVATLSLGQARSPLGSVLPTTSALGGSTAHAALSASGDMRVDALDGVERMEHGAGVGSAWHALSLRQFLPQATFVRSVEWTVGVAVYTGRQTKIGLHSRKPPTKWTHVDLDVSRASALLFAVQLALALCMGIAGTVWKNRVGVHLPYLHYSRATSGTSNAALPAWIEWIVIPVRFLLLTSLFIPISLKVSIDVVKYIYSLFIHWDRELYDAVSDSPTIVRCTAIAEDLGQINDVFMDKTGTLTENEMVFKTCSIGRQIYGMQSRTYCGGDNGGGALESSELRGLVARHDPQTMQFLHALALCNAVVPTYPGAEAFRSGTPFPSITQIAGQVHRAAAAAVAPLGTGDPRSSGWRTSSRVVYQAQSPDEDALVHAAAQLGVRLATRTAQHCSIAVEAPALILLRRERAPQQASADSAGAEGPPPASPGAENASVELEQHITYSILHVLGFTPSRKRMSILLRNTANGAVSLFTKGADDVVLPRIARWGDTRSAHVPSGVDGSRDGRGGDGRGGGSGSKLVGASVGLRAQHAPLDGAQAPQLTRDAVERALERFAETGLRTLCIAGRPNIPEAEVESWMKACHEASVAVNDREARLHALYERMETQLVLYGTTGIEDRLQEGVPESIQLLRRAGLTLWMLTGDKKTTALRIASTCCLTPGHSSRVWTSASHAEAAHGAAEFHAPKTPKQHDTGVPSQGALPPATRSGSQHCGDGRGHLLLEVAGRTLEEVGRSLDSCIKRAGRGICEHTSRLSSQCPVNGFNAAVNPTARAPGTPATVDPGVLSGAGGSMQARKEQDCRSTAAGAAVEMVSRFVTVVIEGPPLELCLRGHSEKFLRLTQIANAVVCCRVTPQWKAQVVSIVKESHLEPSRAGSSALARLSSSTKHERRCLAIGDGGNDVAMIREAHVGVGIQGREGLQAARAADFAIARFRFLPRLLLVHGRQSYRRSCFIAQYCFYKSFVVGCIQLLYALMSGTSGTSLFNSYSLMLYNILFTGVMVFFYPLDCDLDPALALAHPRVYDDGRKRRYFNRSTALQWLGAGVYHAILLLGLALGAVAAWPGPEASPGAPRAALGTHLSAHGGQPMDYAAMGMLVYSPLIVVQCGVFLLGAHSLSWPVASVAAGSAIAFFVVSWVYALMPASEMYMVMPRLYEEPLYWLLLLVATAAALAPLAASRYWRECYHPRASDCLREQQAAADARARVAAGSTAVPRMQ